MLVEAIARNKPNNPSNCQKYMECVGWTGSAEISGEGTANIGVGIAGFFVDRSGASGVIVGVAVGEGSKLAVEVATKGISMMPVWLPHRS